MESATVQIKKETEDLAEDQPDLVDVEDIKSLKEYKSANNFMNNSFCFVNVESDFKEHSEDNCVAPENQFDTSATDDEREENLNSNTKKKRQLKKPSSKMKMRSRTKNNEWQCELCGESFTARRAFRTHMLTHTKDKPYVCPMCGKGFFNASDLKPHIATHSEEYPFGCDQCDMKFKIRWTLMQHSRTHENKKCQCGICLKNFKTKKNLKLHLKLHIQPGDEGQNEKTHSCDQCGKTYKRLFSLKSHMRQHTNDMFKCHVCDKSCLTRSYLRMHLRTHTGEKPFECDICNQRFVSISRLNSHRNRHEGYRKTYECDSCDKVLMSKESLRNHQTVRHKPEQPEEKHQCTLCEKSFKLPMMLMKHLRKCHSDLTEGRPAYDNEQNQNTPFKCHICNKSYSKKLYLEVHLKLHTEGVNPYKCDTCGKEFGNEKLLDCHEKTHQNTDGKTYKCDLCNKVFVIEECLHRHKKKKHPMENQCKLCGEKFETQNKAGDHLCRLKKVDGNLDMESKVSVCEISHADCSEEELEVHMLTHDVKPFKCECFGVFFSEIEYKKHLKDGCEVVKGGLKLVEDVKVENDVKEELEIGFEGVKKEYDD